MSYAFNSWSQWKIRFGQDGHNGNQRLSRRIILMEGVDPRFAELLGVQLGVPPEFWLAHCDITCSLSIVDDKFHRKGYSTYWKASVPQVRGVPKDQKILKKEAYYVEAGGFDRAAYVAEPAEAVKFKQRIEFDSLISFWGHQNTSGGWTGVLTSGRYIIACSSDFY